MGFLVVLALVASLAACGGGGVGGGGGGGKTIPGTTPGTYTFMVEGSFTPNFGTSFSQVSMVTVTIQ